jgi:uncharacterized repeat protein (TIGR03803 family)
MKARTSRFCAIAVISLLSFFVLAAQTSAQDKILNQLRHAPRLRGTTGKGREAKVAEANSDYEVLYSFCSEGGSNCTDGANPAAGLIEDPKGNLYGTTEFGGTGVEDQPGGTVFELSPNGSGGWNETVLYSFCSEGGLNCTDGAAPTLAGLIEDAQGNLYGTTEGGGANGRGTVFELSNSGTGGWTHKLLYSFCSEGGSNCTDGAGPNAGLIEDAQGNFYGTTVEGGAIGISVLGGVVFELSPNGSGGWTYTVLYSFCSEGGSNCTDGEEPGGLIEDEGNLYGTTLLGGANRICPDGCGVVFELLPNGTGWKETVLYSFCSVGGLNCTDGAGPLGRLIGDTGNLYGTTSGGGVNNFSGTVFELAPPSETGDPWIETVLYSFCAVGGSSCTDGAEPIAGLIEDTQGNLYGTTDAGGNSNSNCEADVGGCGTVFTLAPPAKSGGAWTETVLYSFCSATNCTDGDGPLAGLIEDASGNLFGTADEGGSQGGSLSCPFSSLSGCGTVFRLQKAATQTTTTLTTSPNPSAYGQPVSFSASVTSSAGSPPNGETVTFMNGKTTLGTGTLSGGAATLSYSALSVGKATITAVYGGDSNFSGSTSNKVSQVVNQATTVTTLASSQNPSSFGQSVNLTATVAPEFSGTPTGTVTFNNGGTKLGSAMLSGGVASYKTTTLPVGTNLITAVYAGNSSFSASTSDSLSQVVLQAQAKIKLVASPDPSKYDQTVTFTATLTPQFSGKVTGTVTFYDGTTTLQTVTLNKGKATYKTSTLMVGAHSITATYNGSTDFAGISDTLTQTVNSASTTTKPVAYDTTPPN